ncbi:MAG: glycosyltransferase family 9 protein [Bacteroidia bacterium]
MIYKQASAINSIKERAMYWLLKLADYFYLAPRPKYSNTQTKWVLLVKLDLLGDYVLIRNFLQSLKESEQYKNHKVAFCCNAGVQEISQKLDAEFVDQWIPLKLKPFVKDFKYRKSVLAQLRAQHYQAAIFPTQSRSFFYDNIIAQMVSADQKIAPLGNAYNQIKWQRQLGDKWFDKLIAQDFKYEFEFALNRNFFKSILPKQSLPLFPKIQMAINQKQNAVLVSPGASAEFRRWSIENFAKIIEHVLSHYKNLNVLISGAPAEQKICEKLKAHFAQNTRVTNVCGQLKLSDLALKLNTCLAVVTNESGVTHLAKAIGVPYIYCISNANHYQRFNPYPKDDSGVKMRYFYPENFLQALEQNKANAFKKYYWGSSISIESVKAENVKRQVKDDFTKFYKLS